jgi:hypothetical protein
MMFDDFFGDGEPKTASGWPSAGKILDLAKFFKNDILIFFADADPVVDDIHLQIICFFQ